MSFQAWVGVGILRTPKPEELDMSVTQNHGEAAVETPKLPRIDLKLEAIATPVSDVDRTKRFYSDLGWRLDADITGEGFRVLQFTPPGSPCSAIFGSGITAANYLIVPDIEAARAELAESGVDISEVYHYAADGSRVSGPDPGRRSYASWASFSDPDGTGWSLQERTQRLPGRVEASDTSFASSTELAAALRRAAAAHGEHEKRTGQHDENWPDWYAEYIVREQGSRELPT
jgi:catechol 2,3-dioxygenase-like lactoylglutathione lyase family enzyme